jgi:polyisoprenoid-binding protein YceI
MLLAHLRTADFCDVGQHPTAEFVADTAEKIPNSTDGTPNHFLRGNFTLRGISRPLVLPVLIATTDDARVVLSR